MTELDHILDVHRREAERGEAALILLMLVLVAIVYGGCRMIGWIL